MYMKYLPIEEADKYVNSLNDLVATHCNKLNKIEEKEMTSKSKTKFSAGDKVIRTENTSGTGDGGLVQVGGVYGVYSVSHNGKVVNIVDNPYSYSAEYFELFIETPQVDFKNMKFRVSSPEHSKEIQEALFEMGYKWLSGSNTVNYTNAPFLYTEEDGNILTGSFEDTYKESPELEHTLEVVKSYKLIPVETPKEIITINGKTYDKEAVLKRIAALQPVLAELEEVK